MKVYKTTEIEEIRALLEQINENITILIEKKAELESMLKAKEEERFADDGYYEGSPGDDIFTIRIEHCDDSLIRVAGQGSPNHKTTLLTGTSFKTKEAAERKVKQLEAKREVVEAIKKLNDGWIWKPGTAYNYIAIDGIDGRLIIKVGGAINGYQRLPLWQYIKPGLMPVNFLDEIGTKKIKMAYEWI